MRRFLKQNIILKYVAAFKLKSFLLLFGNYNVRGIFRTLSAGISSKKHLSVENKLRRLLTRKQINSVLSSYKPWRSEKKHQRKFIRNLL